MKSKKMLVSVLVVAFLAVVGGSFWLGTYYQEQSRISQIRQFVAGGGQGQSTGMQGDSQQGGPSGQPDGEMGITGKVDKIDSTNITITARMGSQKIEISPDVTVNKPSSGSIEDIKKGTEVLVQGERDSDGKIKAEKIQIVTP